MKNCMLRDYCFIFINFVYNFNNVTPVRQTFNDGMIIYTPLYDNVWLLIVLKNGRIKTEIYVYIFPEVLYMYSMVCVYV